MRVAALWLLVGCPRPTASAPPAAPPTPPPVQEPVQPPMPPPAPVEVAFRWPDGAGCLLSSQREETLTSGTTAISTVSGEGSALVQASRTSNGLWQVEVLDRTIRTQHRAGEGALLQEIEARVGRVSPVLRISGDGVEVLEFEAPEVLAAAQNELEPLMVQEGTIGADLWRTSLPLILGADALDDRWRALWADGWGWAYGRTWTANEPVQLVSPVTGDHLTLTYREVVPCKFNEPEPLCIRLEVSVTPSNTSADFASRALQARVRTGMDPVAMGEATLVRHERSRSGELVIEAPTGLPWRWSSRTQDAFSYAQQDRTVHMTLDEEREVRCDWRVAE